MCKTCASAVQVVNRVAFGPQNLCSNVNVTQGHVFSLVRNAVTIKHTS